MHKRHKLQLFKMNAILLCAVSQCGGAEQLFHSDRAADGCNKHCYYQGSLPYLLLASLAKMSLSKRRKVERERRVLQVKPTLAICSQRRIGNLCAWCVRNKLCSAVRTIIVGSTIKHVMAKKVGQPEGHLRKEKMSDLLTRCRKRHWVLTRSQRVRKAVVQGSCLS